MDFFTTVYLVYAFFSFYFLFLFILIYIQNRNHLFYHPPLTKNYSLSVVVPCYNEEDTIPGAIQSLLDSDYSGLKKIIVVDDCSTDNSYNIIKEIARNNPRVIALKTPKNTGGAGGSKNYGAKFVNTELIGFADADSYPKNDAITKMVGFFDDKKIGAVTSMVLVKERNNLLERLQAIEYKIIAFSRKLLGFVESIYVTPGPLAIYRKKAFDDVGGFDHKNLTEDIEITWHFVAKGYKVDMSLASKVYSVAPKKISEWYRQRIRWNMGGLQTINKYKKAFFKCGMLGFFILPFFVVSWLLGLFGIGIMVYQTIRRVILYYLSTTYSVQAHTAILTLRELAIAPNVLLFFGLFIFFLSLSFTTLALLHSREQEFKKHSALDILTYMLFYLLAYPVILLVSIYRLARGRHHW